MNDWFERESKRMDDRFHREQKAMVRQFGFGMMLVILINLVFWGGLIWFALWALRHFGII